MAWPSVRLWRVCMVGVGVGVRCVYGVLWRCVVCVGTVYGVQALGVRMAYVVYVSCGVRVVSVCVSFYDVVSV